MPPSASSALRVVLISGVPDPRAELLWLRLEKPGPVRSHWATTSVTIPAPLADVQPQNSHAVRRSADTIVRWPSEPAAGAVPGGIGTGRPSHSRSPVGDQSGWVSVIGA